MKSRAFTVAIVGVALAVGVFSQRANAFKTVDKNNPYTLTCTVSGSTTPAFTLDASAYSFQIAPSIGSQSGGAGAGAGMITFEPATITVPATEVTTAVALSILSGPFGSCSLVPTDSTSTLPSLTLNLVTVTGYAFVAPNTASTNPIKVEGKVTLTLQSAGVALPATPSS
jgi:hypothetical protein